MAILRLNTNGAAMSIDSSPSSSASPSPKAKSDTTLPPYSRHEAASTSSLPVPTVKFAPLPNIGPRRRKSNQPLGMAARAQLVRRSRGQQGELVISTTTTTGAMWMGGEKEQRMRIEAMAAQHAEFQAKQNAREVSRLRCDDDDEVAEEAWKRGRSLEDGDSILVFGKNVKLAGRTLWKRMSRTREASPSPAPDRHRQRRECSPLPILIKPVSPKQVALSQEFLDGEREAGGEQNESDDLGSTEDTLLLLRLLPVDAVVLD